jgi:hypothetical protein
MCLTNPSTSYRRWHRDTWSGHVKPGIFSLCSVVRQTQLHTSISLDRVSKTCKPRHTNDKGMSGEEISQRDHGHNLKDLEPIRAWTRPLSALPRARRCARRQSAHWHSPAHAPSACQSLPSVALARAFKTTPGAPHLTPCSPSLARCPSLAPASFPLPAITARASATTASSL